MEKLNRAPAQHRVGFAYFDNALHPAQKRVVKTFLRLDIHRLITVDRIEDQRRIETLRVGGGKSGIPAAIPLHGSPDPVAVTQVNVVSHANFIAVIDDGRSGERHQHSIHQLDAPAIVVQQGRQTAADADIDAHGFVAGILVIHVVAFDVGDHLEGQLVVVAQEQGPLAR